MSYTMYTPLNVWLDPASIPDVVAHIQEYLTEYPLINQSDIEQIVVDYITAHPELVGGVDSVNGKTGEVVLTASDINTSNNTTIQAVLTALSGQISEIVQTITGLDTRVTANATGITNEATARANADTTLGDRITALQGAVGSPLVAATAAAMTDTSKIYVYTGSETGYTNGNWYYYNGSSWVSGGVYNATAINTDTTLTVAGMAADAKATGDVLNDLKSSTDYITGNEAIPYNYKNNWFNTAGNTFDINAQTYSVNFHSAVFDCVGGDVFTITASGDNPPRAWAFVDANNNILSKAYSGEQCDESIVIAPANAVKIVINNRIGGNDRAKPNAVSYKGELVRIQLDNVHGLDGDVETLENAVTEPLYTDVALSFVSATGYYDNVRIFNTYGGITTATINVTEGEKYYVISRNFGNMAVVCLLDSSNAVKTVYPSAGGDSPKTLQVEIPAGISKLMIQRAANYYPTKLGLITGIRNKKPVSVLNGKRVTLIGDSITEKNFRAAVNWPLYLREWCGAVIQNLGVSGTGFYSGSNKYANRIQSIQNPDIIGVALSLNDLIDETFPIGTASDTGTSSLAGYANTFFDSLIAAYPAKPIIAYVQSPWGGYRPGTARSDEWVNVFTQICNLKGIPFYSEMYYGSALKPWVSANRAVYYVSDGEESASQTDDVHPNSEGHKIIARHLYPHFAENLVTTGLDYQ